MPPDEPPWNGDLDDLLHGLDQPAELPAVELPAAELPMPATSSAPPEPAPAARTSVPSWRRVSAPFPASERLGRASSSHFIPTSRPLASTENDRGAAVARRTVATRRKQEEKLPLVGNDERVWAERSRLLAAMADKTSGKSRAKLLIAAAEMAEKCRDLPTARQLYTAAYEAEPKDLMALRAMRRTSLANQDWSAVRRCLEVESGLPIADWERALTFTALAELALHRFADAAAAEKAARAAVTLRRDSVAAHLLLAEACFAQGREVEAWRALEGATEHWADEAAKAALWIDIARALERRGQTKRAAETFAHASRAEPHSSEAWLGLCRTSRATGDTKKAVHAALRLTESVQSQTWRDACRHVAALWLWHFEKQPTEAHKLLAEQPHVLSLRSLAALAASLGDGDMLAGALVELSEMADDDVRGLALAALAEMHIQSGESDQAAALLAAMGDSAAERQHRKLVRMLAALKLHDPNWRLGSEDSSDASATETVGVAAAFALYRSRLRQELPVLQKCLQQADDRIVRLVAIDAALEAGALADAKTALSVKHANPQDKAAQAMVEVALLSQSQQSYGEISEVLRQANQALPAEPLLLRALARQLAAQQPEEAAQLWLTESQTPGGGGAQAAYEAGILLQAAGKDALPVFQRAWATNREHEPALWRTHALLAARHDSLAIVALHDDQAATDNPQARAEHAAHAALWEGAQPAGEPPPHAGRIAQQMLKLLQHQSDDRLAYELSLRACHAFEGDERAKFLRNSAELLQTRQLESGLGRMAWLNAAMAYESAAVSSEASNRRASARSAIECYRKVLERHPQDTWALAAVWRLEVSAENWTDAARRRRDAVQSAADTPARQRALQALVDFDLHLRAEVETAYGSLQALSRLAPDHLPTLFSLQRFCMQQKRERDLLRIEERWCELSSESQEVAAHGRFAARLRLRLADGDAGSIDAWVQSVAERIPEDLWFARRSEHAARSLGDAARTAHSTERIAALMQEPMAKAALTLRAAEAAEHSRGTEAAMRVIGDQASAISAYPTASRLVGRLLESTQNLQEAATAYEQAAGDAQTPRQALDAWYRAGVLWQDKAADPQRALVALRAVAQIDITHLDAFERLSTALRQTERLPELSEWIGKRIEAGVDAPNLLRMRQSQAELCEQLTDRQGLQQALQALLGTAIGDATVLQNVAEIALRNRLWTDAVQALQALTEVGVDRQQLRWALLTLGGVLENEASDLTGAERAYERALQLDPRDAEVAGRVGEIYRKQCNWEKASAFYRSMIEHTTVWEEHRTYSFSLAATLEAQGRVQEAEAVLERARLLAPTDRLLIEEFAGFYRRQNAQLAETRHLQRSIEEIHAVIAEHPTQTELWKGLVGSLDMSGRRGAAAAVASTASSLGIVDVQLSQLLDPQGDLPPALAHVPRPWLVEHFSPPELSLPLRNVLAAAASGLEKLMPLDLATLESRKLTKAHYALRDLGRQVAKQLQSEEPHLWLTERAPRLCLCVSSDPLEIVVGSEWLQDQDESSLRFLLTRAVVIGSEKLSIAVSAPPEQLSLAYNLLLHTFLPRHIPPQADPDQLGKLRKQLSKALSRKERHQLESSIVEVADQLPDLAAWVGSAVYEYANRVALLACGSIRAATQALLLLSGENRDSATSATARIAAARRSAETWSLLMFSISSVYLEAREQR